MFDIYNLVKQHRMHQPIVTHHEVSHRFCILPQRRPFTYQCMWSGFILQLLYVVCVKVGVVPTCKFYVGLDAELHISTSGKFTWYETKSVQYLYLTSQAQFWIVSRLLFASFRPSDDILGVKKQGHHIWSPISKSPEQCSAILWW